MPLDPPARIAILGGGPIGLEAALYARYLGYKVDVLEAGPHPATNVKKWGQVRLFTPFAMNASPLAVAALSAQDPNWQTPAADELLTGEQYRTRYLQPLATSDLLVDSFRPNTRVISIGRSGYRKAQGLGNAQRAEARFEILAEVSEPENQTDDQPAGKATTTERRYVADAVIDCTGTYGNPTHLGTGGLPVLGERTAGSQIERGLPDVCGSQRDHYANQHTVVIGAGYSAATNVTAVAELALSAPQTRITWLTLENAIRSAPLSTIPDDRLPARAALADRANQLAEQGKTVAHRSTSGIREIHVDKTTGQFSITFTDDTIPPLLADRVIANVGHQPNLSLYRELQVHQCYASEGPMKLAAALLQAQPDYSEANADCLDQTSHGPETLCTTEPNFFILGSKSYGRNSNFLLRTGLEQIRDLFTLLIGRKDLDLYATMPSLTEEA